MRINQVARKYGLENRDIITYLESIGVHGKSHSSSIDDVTIEMLLGHHGKLESSETEPAPQSNRKFARIRRPKSWSGKLAKEEEEKPEIAAEAETVIERVPEVEPVETQKVAETIEPVAEKAPEAKKAEIAKPETVEEAPDKAKQAKGEAAVEDITKRAPRKKDRKAGKGKKTDRERKSAKKQKLKTIHLERDAVPPGHTEIVIEAPEIDLDKLDETPLVPPIDGKKREPSERELTVKHDQDEAIRREIQRLKMKQQRITEPEEIVPDLPDSKTTTLKRSGAPRGGGPRGAPRGGRRRPTVVKKKGKGKLAWKREKRERREMQIVEEEKRVIRESTVLKIHDATTVADIASGLGFPVNELIQ